KTIYGATFDHKGETPGLGAEIKELAFQQTWSGKEFNITTENGEYFKVQKPGGAPSNYKVDGITGGTITSDGVAEMVNRTVSIYQDYFQGKTQTSQLK
ncbi:MAG: FMN-binding protein, partial [Bacteroidota bacterium]